MWNQFRDSINLDNFINNSFKSLYKKADIDDDDNNDDEEKEILEIPLSVVIDAVSFGAKNVTTLLARTLEVPPVKVKVLEPIIKEEELTLIEPIHPYRRQTIFEIWKLYLNKIKNDINEAYIVISANYNIRGYNEGEWDSLTYNGFYTTLQEAESEIDGYLKEGD